MDFQLLQHLPDSKIYPLTKCLCKLKSVLTCFFRSNRKLPKQNYKSRNRMHFLKASTKTSQRKSRRAEKRKVNSSTHRTRSGGSLRTRIFLVSFSTAGSGRGGMGSILLSMLRITTRSFRWILVKILLLQLTNAIKVVKYKCKAGFIFP